ncbi:MAG: AsmA-like C-terminal domain-containing protein, partial [Alphaproteobacteria bacterium]
EHPLDIRLRGVHAINANGDMLASVPEMSVALSLRGMLHGVIAPTSFELYNPKVRVVRSADGNFKLGLEDAGPGAGDLATKVITDLIAPLNTSRTMGYLTAVEINDADLTLVDEKLNTTWHSPKADVKLRRDAKGISGQASLGLDLDGERAEIDADVSYDRDARKIDIGLSFANLSPARIAAKQDLGKEIEGFAVPLSGTVTASFDLDGDVEVLGFDVTGGPGKIALPAYYSEPLAISKLALRGRLEENLTRMVVDKAHAELAAITPSAGPNTGPNNASSNGPSIDITGRMFRTGQDIAAQGEAVVANMPVDSLDRYWPVSIATDARSWIRGHIFHGMVPEARAVFAVEVPKGDFGAARLGSLAGTFQAEGLTVAYLPPMLPVENVSGRATFTGRELDIAVTGGTLKRIKIGEGKVVITGLDVKDQDAAIEMVLQGSLQDMMVVVSSDPIDAAKFMGFLPEDVGGEAGVRLSLRMPLLKDLRMADVELAAAANVKDGTIRRAALGQDLDSGDLLLKLDKNGMQEQGTIRLGGVPGTITASQSFSSAAPVHAHFEVAARPNDADLARFGFPVAPYIAGEIPMSLTYTVGQNGAADLQVSADLSRAAMAVKEFNWAKPKGTEGTGRFALSLANDKPTELRNFSVAAGNLTAGGNGLFAVSSSGKSSLQRLDVARLTFGRSDVAGNVVFGEGGAIQAQMRGPQVDASDYFSVKSNLKPKEQKPPPLRIDLAADTLWVGPDKKMRSATLTLDEVDDRWRTLDFQGTLDGPNAPSAFRVTIVPDGAVRKVTAAAGDAGTFLATFNVIDNMLGGQLSLTGTIDDAAPDHPFSGALLIKDYRVVRVPFLAKILTAASLTGIVNVLSGEGIGFTDLRMPMTVSNNVLTINDGRAYGADLGITAKGKLNIDTNNADIEGTVVPAYALNSILGNIPIVGDILTGGSGSGIFAVTYRMTGPIGDPKVDLNPLSALTPGVLRNIFGIFDSGASNGVNGAKKPDGSQTPPSPADSGNSDAPSPPTPQDPLPESVQPEAGPNGSNPAAPPNIQGPQWHTP